MTIVILYHILPDLAMDFIAIMSKITFKNDGLLSFLKCGGVCLPNAWLQLFYGLATGVERYAIKVPLSLRARSHS